MLKSSWTWNDLENPHVLRIFNEPGYDFDWYYKLENAPTDAILGKVLCVCVGVAIAREVIKERLLSDINVDSLERSLKLVEDWINSPSDERFDEICSLIFAEDSELQLNDDNLTGVVFWSLRIATSSIGNYEAGWALDSLCNAATRVGMTSSDLRKIAQRDLISRIYQE